MRYLLQALAFAIVMLASSGAAVTDARAGPEITAQGFDISLPREGRLGQFDRLRIRVEAPERIKELAVTERSYAVDLATTLDEVNYRLFGIEKRVRLHKDVTLNFQNYINEKIVEPGEYVFLIRVKDQEDEAATARLRVIVVAREEPTAAREVQPPKTGVFRLVRTGPGRVEGAGDLGITWKTIDEVAVVIRIKGSGEAAAIAARPAALDYDKISAIADLPAASEPDAVAAPAAYVDLPTANNAAAGHVLEIETPAQLHLMKLNRSETSLSASGTTVVLEGEYKTFEK